MTDITLPRDVVEQALDALKSSDESGCDEFLSIIDALEERLAQPEQESFSPEAISATQAAWKMGYDAAKAEQPEQEPAASIGSLNEFTAMELVNRGFALTDYLYTAPPQREWQRLTDKEREEATGWSVEHIEAKLKEKNT